MNKKLSIKLKSNKFNDLVSKLKDVSNINEVVKIKIDRENTLLYSLKANDNAVLALKSYLLNTSEYFENFNEDEIYNYIIVNTPKLIKGLHFFDDTNDIKMELIARLNDEEGYMQIRSVQFTNNKLKILSVGGEDSKIKDLTSEAIESRTSIDNSDWNFQISKSDFQSIKKLCSIDSEEKILNFNINKGKVYAGEDSKWELYTGDANKEINYKIVFNKKYLSNINQDIELIDLYMFETFILVKDNNSNLMLSFEQTWEDET
jgi:hypothetical protein